MVGEQPRKVDLAVAFARFDEAWSPKVVASLDEHLVKVVKLRGTFEWHHHEDADEMFLVVAGRMRMGLRSGDVDLGPGELIVVAKGVEHRPQALSEECSVVLIERADTLNTGNIETERTVRELEILEF
jgi:mannose-6-phosphate isomerase-like protein (cupin superfamily)